MGTSSAGGTADLAKLYDSATTDDSFVANATQAQFTGGGGSFSSQANGFHYVNAYSSGGTDVARLDDSTGTDTFVATPTYSVMYASAGASNPAYANRPMGFKVVNAFSTHGGGDTARLYDSPGNDIFTAAPTYAQLTNDPRPTRLLSHQGQHLPLRPGYSRRAGRYGHAGRLPDATTAENFQSYPNYAELYNNAVAQPF